MLAGASREMASPSECSLDSLPTEVLDIIIEFFAHDVKTLRACLLTRILFESAVNVLWRDVVLPASLTPSSRTVLRLLRRGAVKQNTQSHSSAGSQALQTAARRPGRSPTVIYPYGQWIRSLSVFTTPADLPLRGVRDIVSNLDGGLLRTLILSLRDNASQDIWATVFDTHGPLADQIRELHLLGIHRLGDSLLRFASRFSNLKTLRLEVADESQPDALSDLLLETVETNTSLTALEFSDSAGWFWANPVRLEGSLGSLSKCGQNLTVLRLRGIRFCDQFLLRDLAEGLGKLQDLGLKDFWLEEGASFNGFFETLPKLTSLRMENTTAISEAALANQNELQSLSLCMDFSPGLLNTVACELQQLVDLDVRSLTSHIDVDIDSLAPIADKLESLYLDHIRLVKISPEVKFPVMKRFGLGPAVIPQEGSTLGATAAKQLFDDERFGMLHTAGLAAFYGELGDRVDHRWVGDVFLVDHPSLWHVFLGKSHSSFVSADRLPELRRKHKKVLFDIRDWFQGHNWA
jgi:hypothetical protein